MTGKGVFQAFRRMKKVSLDRLLSIVKKITGVSGDDIVGRGRSLPLSIFIGWFYQAPSVFSVARASALTFSLAAFLASYACNTSA